MKWTGQYSSVSFGIGKDTDMWPYLCLNPNVCVRGGFYFYMTKCKLFLLFLHAYLACTLLLVVVAI